MTDIVRKRGDTKAEEWQVKSKKTGAVVDITGYSFTLTVNSEENPTDDSNQLFQITGSITNASDGKFECVPTADQADQTPTDYYYDIRMIDGSGRKTTYDYGLWTVEQNINKD